VHINLTKVMSAALSSLAVGAVTIAIEASVSTASPTAGIAAQQRLSDDTGANPDSGAGANRGPDPNYWQGGNPAGGTTSLDPEPNLGSGADAFNGGSPAGGTGIDTGPDVGSGPGVWNGGESAGAS
jgi:hypothetical protein